VQKKLRRTLLGCFPPHGQLRAGVETPEVRKDQNPMDSFHLHQPEQRPRGSRQVGSMGKIYSKTSTILVYMGEYQDGSSNALPLLKIMQDDYATGFSA
jgi:hypothetical protein